MTVNEIRQKRAEHWENMKAFLNERQTKDGRLSVDDTATYENMEAELQQFDAAVQRAEDAERREAELNKGVNTPLLGNPGGAGKKGTGRSSDEYNAAFLNYIRTRRPVNTLQEGVDADGGYLVPTEFERALFAGRDRQDPIFEMAGRLMLGSMTKEVPYVADKGEAGWISEGGSYPESDDSFGQVILRANKIGRIVKATEEMIADSAFDIIGYLAESLGRSIGKGEARAFWTGNGIGKPLGVMNCAGTGVTTAGNKPTADELLDLFYSIEEQYRSVSYFAMNSDTVKEMRKLKTGEGQYLWTPGLNGQSDSILGRPLRTSQYIDTIAAGKGVIAFGDFLGCYKIADRQGFDFRILNEKYADTGEVGFRGGARTDGKGILADKGIKLLKIHA